ncbi:MAG: hypothetical protein JNK04_18985 [Myxococcales bacterium]|nr:hypothetical protein [Myxococcales bacterium]
MELCRGLACVFGVLMLVGCPGETETGNGGSTPQGPECEVDADCPKGECETAKCEASACVLTPLEQGIVVDIQLAGDCLDKVCDGEGSTEQVANMDDTPTIGDECVTYSCGPSGLEFVFNNGVPCSDGGYCIENPQDDDPANYECVECTQDSHCDTSICDEQEGSCSPATCGNGLMDGNETAEDCGGQDCPSCANGLACVDDDDCLSGNCQADLCAPAN